MPKLTLKKAAIAAALIAAVMAFTTQPGSQDRWLTTAIWTGIALVLAAIAVARRHPSDPLPRDAAAAHMDDDAPEWTPDIEIARDLGRRVWLRYQDAGGKLTERTVTVRTMMGDAATGRPTRIVGHCSLRRSVREFRLDRVRAAADPETGEIIPDLGRFLLRRQ